VPVREFNSYGSRRGNHEVMMRGTFANIRIKNEMLDGVEGGYTKGPTAADLDLRRGDGLSGAGHAAGGLRRRAIRRGLLARLGGEGHGLLGVKAVIAESFERIHRSNLVGMGVIPFEFTGGDTRKTLGLTGDETVSIHGLDTIQPLQEVPCTITYGDGTVKEITLKCRIDTAVEIEYIEHGGVLHYVLRNLAKAARRRRDPGPSRHDRGEPDLAHRADGPDAECHGAGRRDREHLLAQRRAPAHGGGRLHRHEGRARCRDHRLRAGAGTARHPRECRRARADREAGGAAPGGDRRDGGGSRRRWAGPERPRISRAVAFLLSEDARFITGQVLTVSGGYRL
jgi:hypothetical protein